MTDVPLLQIMTGGPVLQIMTEVPLLQIMTGAGATYPANYDMGTCNMYCKL